MKFSFKKECWSLLIIVAAVVLSIVAYPALPETVVSHWNFQGRPDGFMSRDFHSWFFPILLAAIYLLFRYLPMLDPKKERYQEFAGVYEIFKNLILAVLFVTYAAATLYNLGWNINIGAVVGTTVGLLMIVLGNYLGKIKRNWFVGIKTPWTLSSENVWNKTHRLGGRLFVGWGFLIIIAPYLPETLGLVLFIGGAVAVTLGTMAYSYILYIQEKKIKKS